MVYHVCVCVWVAGLLLGRRFVTEFVRSGGALTVIDMLTDQTLPPREQVDIL